jgi:hypothetical protein|tara:strand:- start:452 stop:628 length:177 start_codon:yes stop_codon:yes gene_type:complete
MSSQRKKKMLLNKDLTQEDIDEAVELKTIIEQAMEPTSPEISFEMLLLWWLTVEPAMA